MHSLAHDMGSERARVGRREPLAREVSKGIGFRGGLHYAYSPVMPMLSPQRIALNAHRARRRRNDPQNGDVGNGVINSARRTVRRHPYEAGFLAGVVATRPTNGRTMTWQ